MPEQELLNLLETYQIPYQLHNHEPIFTADEANHIKTYISGVHTKNLFLRDKKKKFYLVTILDDKRVDLKLLSKVLGGHLSFGSADDLYAMMGVKPGSVTPFGLMYDRQKEIDYILDEDIVAADMVNFHPLRNDMTIHMTRHDFLNLLPNIHRHPQILKIPVIS